jgi:hypothetical protein
MRWSDAVVGDVQPLEEGDVNGAIRMIRNASVRDLRNEAFLREEFLLALGLNGEIIDEFPQQLYPWCGRGIRSWQYPIQFASYLTYLSGKKIKSYIEIGCRFGGTFIIVVEYLRRFSDVDLAVALDIENFDVMKAYATQTIGIEYKVANSRDPEIISYIGSRQWDLAFIDGDHSFQGCFSDLLAVKDHARITGLHDIASSVCPGVVQTWQGIRNVVPRDRIFESVDQYRDVRDRTKKTFLGIGLVDFS